MRPAVPASSDSGGSGSESADSRHAARSAVWQTLTMLGQGLLPLQRVLVSRLFGQTLYGSFRIAADLVEMLARTGMVAGDKGLLRFLAADRVAGDRHLESSTVGTALRLSAGGGLLLALALAAAGPSLARLWHSPALASMLPIMAPTVLLAGLAFVMVAATLAARVTRANLLVRGIGEPALLLALTVAAALVSRSAEAVGAAYTGAYVVVAGLAVLATATLFGGRWLLGALRSPTRPAFVPFVLPLALAEFSNALLQRAHVFLLSALSGPRAVALFAAGEELGRPVTAVRYVFDPIAAVAVAECFRLGDRARLSYNVQLITRWVASASAPIAATVVVLRRELLALYGPGYGPGASAMILLVVAHLANGVMGVGAGVIPISGRPTRFLFANLGAALVNVVLCFVLIPRLGVFGAALASLVATVAMLALLVVDASRLEGVHPFHANLAKPFLAAAVAGAGELAVHALPLPTAVRVVAVIVAGLGLYLGVLFALDPGAEERRIILQALAALRPRRPRGSGTDRGDGS